MKCKHMMAAFLSVSLLSACSSTNTDKTQVVKEKKITDVKGLVQDYSEGKKSAENASITSQQLIVTDKDGKETAYQLPKKEFFVSIAPYVNETHT